MNAALMEDVRSELHKGGRGPGDHQMRKISNMQTTLRVQQNHLKDAEIRAQGVILLRFMKTRTHFSRMQTTRLHDSMGFIKLKGCRFFTLTLM